MINVDLLITNKNSEILLTWRDSGEKYKAGWHFPGGIIRLGETIKKRIEMVAKIELGSKIKIYNSLLAINEIHLNQLNRSHFISLLYKVRLKSTPKSELKFLSGLPKPGQWMWHRIIPKNLIKPHLVYKNFFKKKYVN